MTKIAKKKSSKKQPEEKGTTGVKYEDKSKGQPELVYIFEELKTYLTPYEKDSLTAKQSGGQYHLWSNKEIEVEGHRRNDVYFAGLLVQKGYVGFYYMPVYANPSLKNKLKPELLKYLKGKSCFHIKKLDDNLKSQIKDALETGYEYYKKLKWV
jgi:hypothetical protein